MNVEERRKRIKEFDIDVRKYFYEEIIAAVKIKKRKVTKQEMYNHSFLLENAEGFFKNISC